MKKIIRHNGEIIGYAIYAYAKDDSRKRNIEILWVEVFKKFRRQGFASKLLKELLKELKKKKIIWVSLWTGLEIEKKNAIKIYEKLGFEEKVYQKDYYRKGIGTRMFAKKLN